MSRPTAGTGVEGRKLKELPPLRRRDRRVLEAHADGKPFRIASEREGWVVGILRSRGFLEHSSGANYRITPAGRAFLAALPTNETAGPRAVETEG